MARMVRKEDKGPMAVTVGTETKWICMCGLSGNQPFCDGSHVGSGLTPKRFTAKRSERVWLCVCKATRTPPYCDGSHNKLKEMP